MMKTGGWFATSRSTRIRLQFDRDAALRPK